MRQYAYVYVGKPARKNFRLGMDKGTWGWRLNDHGRHAAAAMTALANPRAANYLVFAQDVRTVNPPPGWPRVPDSDPAWNQAYVDKLILAQVTRPLYEDTEELWDDDVYPYRVSFDSPIELPQFPAGDLSLDVVFAIRTAALNRGLPVLGPAPVDETDIPPGETADDEPVPDRLLGDTDGLDGLTRALFRREQTMLRRKAFGRAATFDCGLCQRNLPVSLLRLAHIKRRADATTEERLNRANTMPACTLGCDELFERGYVVVDPDGRIRRNTLEPITPDLETVLTTLDGLTVPLFTERSAPFFAAHAARHGWL